MKRPDPSTGKPFKRGDAREDGYLFEGYDKTRVNKKGEFYENWKDPEKHKNRTIATASRRAGVEKTKAGHIVIFLRSAKRRAKLKNLSFDLDKEHLLSIATDECPIFKTKFNWGIAGRGYDPGGPSLDRIIPELGYVKENVIFISVFANNVKSNATEKELYAIADWLHDKRKEVLDAFKGKPTPVPAAPDTPGRKYPEHRITDGPRPR